MVNDEGRPYLSLECIRSIYSVQPEKRPTLLIKTNERRLQQKNHRSKKEGVSGYRSREETIACQPPNAAERVGESWISLNIYATAILTR